jgi:hypothetical protein
MIGRSEKQLKSRRKVMSRIDVALQTLSILQRDGLSREEIALKVNVIKVIEDVLNPKTVAVEAPKSAQKKKPTKSKKTEIEGE